MSYTRKLNYKDYLLIQGILFQQKKVSEGYKLVSAKICKKLVKAFEKTKELVEEAKDEAKIPGSTFKEPDECTEEITFELTKEELLIIGSCIVDIHKNKEFAASTSYEILDITEKLILNKYVDKHCDIGKIDTTGFDLEEDSKDLEG